MPGGSCRGAEIHDQVLVSIMLEQGDGHWLGLLLLTEIDFQKLAPTSSLIQTSK